MIDPGMNTPAYAHDCDRCTFLGGTRYLGARLDLYHCDQGGVRVTLIVRFGDDGRDYTSLAPDLIDAHPDRTPTAPLRVALMRAAAMWLPLESPEDKADE